MDLKNKKRKSKSKIDLEFIKSIAKDFGHTITDREAEKAHREATEHASKENYYYYLKEYFLN